MQDALEIAIAANAGASKAAIGITVPWAVFWGCVAFVVAAGGTGTLAAVFWKQLRTQFEKRPLARVITTVTTGGVSLLSGFAVEWAGFSEIRSGAADLSDLFWFLTAILIASAGYAATIAVTLISDSMSAEILDLRNNVANKVKELAAKEVELDAEKKQVIREAAYTSLAIKVCSIFLEVVNIKKKSIVQLIRAVRKRNRPIQLSDLREHMNPNDQITRIIEIFRKIFEEKVTGNPNAQVRVTLFTLKGDAFNALCSVDNRGHEDCVTGPSDANRHWFNQKHGMSLAAKAARVGEVKMVSDTGLEPNEFAQFGPTPSTVIKSIACLPIGTRGKQCNHVISIDCNMAGFFSDTDSEKKWLEFMRENAEARLLFEFEMDKLLPAAKVNNFKVRKDESHDANASKPRSPSNNSKRSGKDRSPPKSGG